MVIGVEGNVHVGKTTFINAEFSNYNIIKEIEFKPQLSDYERQRYYIEKEIRRKKSLLGDSIIDRTILSTIIYTLYNNVLPINEKKKIISFIKKKIDLKEIIIPENLLLILYPYKLINNNHKKLMKIKGTQNLLVDYRYYLQYSLFFSNRFGSLNKIFINDGYRQILSYTKEIFNNATIDISINSKVLLDGCPAIGKTTIGKKQNKYRYIEEFKYKKYTLNDYQNQIDSIVERIKILNNGNILLDTSFLMGITHLFYNELSSREFKLKMIDELIKKVPLNYYVTKIIYLLLEKEEIINRKDKDHKKKRNHFYDNINYLDFEINFYKVLDKRLGFMSNITFIEASDTIENLAKMIETIEDKPLLLIDLFYEIREAIREGVL